MRNSENLGSALQLWKATQQLGSGRAGSAAPRVGERKTIEFPPSVGGAVVAAALAAAAEPEEKKSPDEAYIETPRCTTCNECTQINDKMFAYNADKQAYIVNPDAGTYAQMVEAAKSCQVSIIHPGKPRNLGEPGLEELLKR